ncbi:hypothetical protein CPLU01_08323 [Colletotrichum plurivorum]|uniref:Uncharacterized protein n=1 Tax=Colletotrichum plurivorum TaxID=2175906 RepID=A0A8H6KC92_9PEZI|nr:hypothetical protein CPLU01_08323 [Colletotrichum plurivorum]
MTSHHQTSPPTPQQQHPLIPPSPSHHKRLIARSPLSPLPPPDPKPWIWRCHACGTVFRLSCTRRCLECGHVLCTTAGVGRRGRRTRPCRMEFDYVAWAARGRWRRDIGASSSGDGTGQRKRKLPPSWDEEDETARGGQEARPTCQRRNCWRNCDFPSQCRYAGQQDAPRLGEALVEFEDVDTYYDAYYNDDIEDDDEAGLLAGAEYFGEDTPGSADDLLPVDPALEFEIFSDAADEVVPRGEEGWKEWWDYDDDDDDSGTRQNENVNIMNKSESEK